jgi:hypothetical protein
MLTGDPFLDLAGNNPRRKKNEPARISAEGLKLHPALPCSNPRNGKDRGERFSTD